MSPGATNPASVRCHLVALDEILTRLGRYTGRDVATLDTDIDQRWAVERGLQLCTQCVLDIATHLCASAGRDAPDYASAIDELGHLGILPVELASRLRPLAGFRNALVHGYPRIEPAVLHGVPNGHPDEVREFARPVDGILAPERVLSDAPAHF